MTSTPNHFWMTEFFHNWGRDCAFASVATCTALWSAEDRVPQKVLAFSTQSKHGETVTIHTEKKVHAVVKYIYGS